MFQWIYYTPTKDEKPTIYYPISFNNILCVLLSAVNEGGSGDLFAETITTTYISLYRGYAGVTATNLVKNRTYSALIIGY